MARGRRPERLGHDDGFRFLESAGQTRQVLMMMERVAAAPIDQPDIGIDMLTAVIAELTARIEQQVSNTSSVRRNKSG